ncbi:unnamed protein product [Pseudo-nitzschia multistriata]|uniref:JmjC domain-containing protein n=1 Tax=Pseudo-nitzschia multistriata TaxID=183589 RepID=A0A448Z0V4_9STRA|nr:unnamed protein product [Pseudo-nitzschia multistriata]
MNDMLLKRLMTTNTTSRKKTVATTTSPLSLSSRRGTTAAITKKHKRYVLFVSWKQQYEKDPTRTVLAAAMAALILAAAATAIVEIFLVSSTSLRPRSPTVSVSRLVAKSMASISISFVNGRGVRRPRGHRYYDYWRDEDHEDFEPYPWKFMKRPFSSSGSKNADVNNLGIALDDETYVPEQTLDKNSNANIERKLTSKSKEDVIFNDRSSFYAKLRQSYESFFPPPYLSSSSRNDANAKRALQAVEDLQTYTNLQTYLSASNPVNPDNSDSSGNSSGHNLYYDIHNCTEEPLPGYPKEWNLLHDVLGQWPADDPELPASGTLYQGLCVFDLQANPDDLRKAIAYRNAEVPFVVRGDPAVAQTVERWNAPHYLEALLGDLPHGTETSASGSFTYWTANGVDSRKYPMDAASYKAPTDLTEMTFAKWMALANVTDPQLLGPESPHYYFRVVGCAPARPPTHHNNGHGADSFEDNTCSILPGKARHVPYLADELPFYTQTKASLYVKEPLAEKIALQGPAGAGSKALNCRFGMKGVMTTNHFDGERNFVTVLSGERRYILAHPRQCGNMALFPYGHPSARHSSVDWARPDLLAHPRFEAAEGNEVVLQAGDSLFLPSLWFHYIVSMSTNIQCNTRSGMDGRHVSDLDESCGW